jgi:hypothetical protein
MPTPCTPDSVRSGKIGKKDHVPGPDTVSELDDLPVIKSGLFFGLMGA